MNLSLAIDDDEALAVVALRSATHIFFTVAENGALSVPAFAVSRRSPVDGLHELILDATGLRAERIRSLEPWSQSAVGDQVAFYFVAEVDERTRPGDAVEAVSTADYECNAKDLEIEDLLSQSAVMRLDLATTPLVRSGLATATEMLDMRPEGDVWSGRFLARWEDGLLSRDHPYRDLDLEEALSWCHSRSRRVELRVGGERFSAGEEPIPGAPRWSGGTPLRRRLEDA